MRFFPVYKIRLSTYYVAAARFPIKIYIHARLADEDVMLRREERLNRKTINMIFNVRILHLPFSISVLLTIPTA